MADEVRRSGRANKGHHTKNQDILDEPVAKPKTKGKASDKNALSARSQSAQSENEGEEDAIIRCVCGDQRDIRGRQMIACEKCEAWQHVKCLGLEEGDHWDTKTYYCEQCRPEDHKELLEAMARGEKPWNRKKGAKQSKPKSARPSEVRAETEQENKSPQSPAVQTSQQPATEETPRETSNGHSEAKSKKRSDGHKSQPQSPIGEKRRRETISEKDGTDTKRRKSTAQQHSKQSRQEVTVATEFAALPPKQKTVTEGLSKHLVDLIKVASEQRGFRVPDGSTPSSIAERLALEIDAAAVSNYGPPTTNDAPYTAQFRKIIFNTKKNPALVDRLLSGSLTANEISIMSAEDMASEDKQREYAALRELNDKQVVLEAEKGPRIRKTHKGDELIDEEEQQRTNQESVFTVPERRHRDSVQEDGKVAGAESSAEGGSPMRVELPEDIGRAPLSVDTSASQNALAGRHPSSASFDPMEAWRHVSAKSPDQDQSHRRQSSIAMQTQQQEGPGEDPDIDRLLKDEDNDTTTYSPADYSNDPSVCWHGTVDMQSVGSFAAVARHVAGGDIGQRIPWNQLLPNTLPISGRIDKDRGNDYVASMRGSATIDITVLSLSPVNNEGRQKLDMLFHYFYPRGRWGVVPTNKLASDAARDLYVIPVDAGPGPLPPFLDMLEHCIIETPRPAPMILLALVAKTRTPETTPAADGSSSTPAQDHRYPSVPATHPGPQFSPVTNYPPSGNYGSPYHAPHAHPQATQQGPPPTHHQIPKALEILGVHIDAPVVVHLLQSVPNMAEVQMRNLRTILDREPNARSNMNMLQDHLRRKSEQDAREREMNRGD